MRPRSVAHVSAVAVLAAAVVVTAARAESDFLLIDRTLDARMVRVVEINDGAVVYRGEGGRLEPLALTQCIALTRTTTSIDDDTLRTAGLLVLADGQRLPGFPAPRSGASGDVLVWEHAWLHRLDVPIDHVERVTFRPDRPLPQPRREDVIVLLNGDVLDGFVTGLGDPLTIDVDWENGQSAVSIPLDRAAGTALVPKPKPIDGRRLWFGDGTVIDARRLIASDDGYLDVATAWTGGGAEPPRVADLIAVLFDPAACVPLARLEPTDVRAVVPRYHVPPPRVLDANAALGLGRVLYRGPVIVRYELPAGCRRFAADLSLPTGSRTWGDLGLVVRDDDREVFRANLSGANPTARVNVPISGSEFTIELTQGANGPIQDVVVMNRAMFLVGPE